jgi:hypothetical protein
VGGRGQMKKKRVKVDIFSVFYHFDLHKIYFFTYISLDSAKKKKVLEISHIIKADKEITYTVHPTDT